MKNYLFLFVLLLPFSIFAQQNPPNIEWKEITTKNFRVVYPVEIQQLAFETAYMMDSIYKLDTRKVIYQKPKKIDLFLYNKSVVSNAYAALGPRRMTWYLTPPSSPSIALSPWNMLLGIHEFRHVTQFAMMDGGFTYLAHLFFGQYGWAAMSSWAYPNWFFEGDAVYHETIFSNSGRGRLPSFSLPLRTIYHSNKKISYEKALFRSYKDYYPNHYYLGYHMVSFINRHNSEAVWNQIISRTNLFSFWPYSFERSVKKYTGSNIRKTYKKTFKEFDSLWTKYLWDDIDTTVVKKVVTTKKRTWTNYFDPQVIGKDSILMLKSGLDNNTQIVLWTGGKEKIIREIPDENISYAKNKIIWTSYTTNVRFLDESYLDIYLYDLKNQDLKQITKNGKYFSPDISHDGKQIVAVKIEEDLIPSIVILDLDGNEIYTYKGVLNDHFMKPVWTSDDKAIVFLKLNQNGESMILLDPKKTETSTILPTQWVKFDNPYAYKNYIIFNYDYSGITNIYAVDLTTKNVFMLTSRPYGTSMAVVDPYNSKLIFTDYQLKGLDVVETDFDKKNWTPLSFIVPKTFEYFKSDTNAKTLQALDFKFTKNHPDYKVKDYKPFKHYINPHSWSLISNLDDIGIQIFSDDKLNTMSMIYQIDMGLHANNVSQLLSVSYKKYFPVFSFNVYGGKYSSILDNDVDYTSGIFGGYDSVATWKKVGAGLTVSTPLDFSKDIYYRTFNFAISGAYDHVYSFSPLAISDMTFDYSKQFSFNAYTSFTNRRLKSYRDLYPKWGEYFEAGATFIPKIFDLQGYKYYAQANFYFPGLMLHHGIRLNLSAEIHNPIDSGYMYIANSTSFPRGMYAVQTNELYKVGIDYTLPLFYPDINIPYLLFIKRVRASIFADYAYAGLNGARAGFYTAGVDLIADFNILRFNIMTFNAGVRVAYTSFNGKVNFIPIFLDIPF